MSALKNNNKEKEKCGAESSSGSSRSSEACWPHLLSGHVVISNKEAGARVQTSRKQLCQDLLSHLSRGRTIPRNSCLQKCQEARGSLGSVAGAEGGGGARGCGAAAGEPGSAANVCAETDLRAQAR